MAFSSGTFSLYSPGNPVVTGTTISSTWANNTLNDIATGLSTCVLKDGSQTITANIPMGGFKFTGLAAGSADGNSLRYEQLFTSGTVTLLGALTTPGNISTSGTGTITAAGNLVASAHTVFEGVTSTGATGTGKLVYDGSPTLTTAALGSSTATTQSAADNSTKLATTAYVDGNKVVVRASQATTSGVAWDFTSIPSWATTIVVMYVGFSTNGTSVPIIQLGSSSTPVATGYLCTASGSTGGTIGSANFTTGFGISDTWAATHVSHGTVFLSRQNAASFIWTCAGNLGQSDSARSSWTAGSKTLAAALDMVRLTMANGTDAGDAGSVARMYW